MPSQQSNIKTKLAKFAEYRKANSLIVYFTSDKAPESFFSAHIASDILEIFYKQLKGKGHTKKISILLYTSGGKIDAPWPIVSLLREYCDTLEVVVCRKALSAGTLVCLGADKIVMSPISYLSPIDPRGVLIIGNEKKEIEIENISSFLRFAKERVGTTDQGSLVEIMRSLMNEIPPTFLGSVYRTHFLIRTLAEKMFNHHKSKLDDQQAAAIISNLTEKLYAHNHLISRKEARDIIGFKNIIDYTTKDEEDLLEKIYAHYASELKLEEQFNLHEFTTGLQPGQSKELKTVRAIIESAQDKYIFKSKFDIILNPPGAGKPFTVNEKEEGWQKV